MIVDLPFTQSLTGDMIHISNQNGQIQGTFNTSKSLYLSTHNAPINVHASLTNNNAGPFDTTQLIMRTTNGYAPQPSLPVQKLILWLCSRISSDITLSSRAQDRTGGQFRVNAHTSNAPLELIFVDAPVDSMLTTSAQTENAPARVVLHKTYEGAFDLVSSTFFRPEVQWDDVEDPKGTGRSRTVAIEPGVSSTAVRGSVTWEERPGAGNVSVRTSNSPLRLLL